MLGQGFEAQENGLGNTGPAREGRLPAALWWALVLAAVVFVVSSCGSTPEADLGAAPAEVSTTVEKWGPVATSAPAVIELDFVESPGRDVVIIPTTTVLEYTTTTEAELAPILDKDGDVDVPANFARSCEEDCMARCIDVAIADHLTRGFEGEIWDWLAEEICTTHAKSNDWPIVKTPYEWCMSFLTVDLEEEIPDEWVRYAAAETACEQEVIDQGWHDRRVVESIDAFTD